MARSNRRARAGVLRIIGGQWRGRRLHFTPADGLRPTADRTRETLFNWLAPDIHGARCADLFAGSGALGLEALSRGALSCDFVEAHAATASELAARLRALDAGERARCHRQSAESFLHGAGEPYDVVFIDPPFGRDLAAGCLALLARRDLLRRGAAVYLETAAEPPPPMPPHWHVHREQRAGGVALRLLRRQAEP